MRKIIVLKEILQEEPEEWLAYLYGQQLDGIPYLRDSTSRFKGVVFRVIIFFAKVARSFRFRRQKYQHSRAEYLFFSGTLNQYESLKPVMESLKDLDAEFQLLVTPFLKEKVSQDGFVVSYYSVSDILQALYLFCSRVSILYGRLSRKNAKTRTLFFDKFCEAYIWLPYFLRILDTNKPSVVIVSNDHSVPNRCLLAVCRYLKIRTVYLQHASVSELFPALRVDYAFLDGVCALETYEKCEDNLPATLVHLGKPVVYLSGQKKRIQKCIELKPLVVGVAVNVLDETQNVCDLIGKLSSSGFPVCLRWHPAHSRKEIDLFLALSDGVKVTISNPSIEPVGIFLRKLGFLVAANSSIHLEAVLAGVRSIYYEISPAHVSDYYGYVKEGIAIYARDDTDLLERLRGTDNHLPDALAALRRYSASYGTPWEGREGELVAKNLMRICERSDDGLSSKSPIDISVL